MAAIVVGQFGRTEADAGICRCCACPDTKRVRDDCFLRYGPPDEGRPCRPVDCLERELMVVPTSSPRRLRFSHQVCRSDLCPSRLHGRLRFQGLESDPCTSPRRVPSGVVAHPLHRITARPSPSLLPAGREKPSPTRPTPSGPARLPRSRRPWRTSHQSRRWRRRPRMQRWRRLRQRRQLPWSLRSAWR